MSASEDQINQWLEEGLRHYGLGDPAKALDVWLQVLASDADNSRAKEYVEIVRSSYGDEAVESAEANQSGDAEVPTEPVNQDAASAASESPALETLPSEALPSETTPSETTPSETTPSETTPSETTPPAEDSAVVEPAGVDASSSAADEVEASNGTSSVAGGASVDDDSGALMPMPAPAHPTTDTSLADPLPVTSVDESHVDPLDSIDGPSWADVAADAEVASESFDSTSYSTARVVDATTELSDSGPISDEISSRETIVDSEADAPQMNEDAPAEGVTSGAAGPVEIEVSDDTPDSDGDSTTASVKIGRAAPIEESVSNVVHSVRYGESFDDASAPRAGAFFASLKEKGREESATTESLELNRSDIIESPKPLPVTNKLPNGRDTIEIRADEMAALAASNDTPATSNPPPERPDGSPLVEAIDDTKANDASTAELDRPAIDRNTATVQIPPMDLTLSNDAELASVSSEMRLGANANDTIVNVSAPAQQSKASETSPPQSNADIFAPTPLANVPTTPGNLFDDGVEGPTIEEVPESVGDALKNAWGQGGPTMDLDVDPAAPSMFDMLLSSSDRSNESKPMDVGVLRHRKSPEDGKRGASQDLAPLTSTPTLNNPARKTLELPPDSSSEERHECEVLMDGAKELFSLGDFSGSLELVEKVLEIDDDHAEARNYFKQNAGTLLKMYESKLGNLQGRPTQLTSPDEVIWMNMHHRAGFVLSQVDGGLTYEEIADVSGLPRLETFRILVELKQNGVIG